MADIPDNPTTTSTLTVGGTASGSIEVVDDHDWFRINLTAGQAITVTVNGVTLSDTYLNIRDSAGNILFSNDDLSDSSLNSQVAFSASYTGVYYIDVSAWHDPMGAYQGTGTYQVSVQPYTPPPLATNDQIANQLVYGYWGGDRHHFNVTQGGTITVNISTLTAAEQNLARAALQEWTDIIGVNFREVATGGQIVFDHSEGTDGPTAATDARWSNGITTSAHVQISTSWVTRYGTGLYSYSMQTYVHEIGHALGLGHAGNYNGTATYPYDALFQNDAWSTSIMSYFDESDNTYFAGQGFTTEFALTPMVADILAMQNLYGLSTSTRTGDTIYGFNTNAGGVYDASSYPRAGYTIFDSAGNDTLDFSGSGASQLLNLNPETFSNADGQVGNISIARGVVIENATGGSGADTIIGNSAANVLRGNGGNDRLTGGVGNDTFLDTKAGHNGDTITDFSAGDVIVFSDATLGSFSFNLTGTTLSYSGGALTLASVPSGTIVASAYSGGGVQLAIGAAATAAVHPQSDFNGDGRSDVVLVNDNGTLTDWLGQTNGTFVSNHVVATYTLSADWHVSNTGDFNGDGRTDLLLRNDNGSITEWLGQTNGGFAWNSTATYALATSWHVAGSGDFNGDGRGDVLLVNDNGSVTDWLGQANGTFFSNHAAATYALPTGWNVANTGDFNGDGRDDLLLRKADGTVTEWLGQTNGGFSWNSAATYGLSTAWHVVGGGDFDGDGRGDVLLRNNDGTIARWLGQADGTFGWSAGTSYGLDNAWHIQQTGDFNGDGRDDILLRHDNGTISEWLGQSGGTFSWNSGASYGLDNTWHVQPQSIFL